MQIFSKENIFSLCAYIQTYTYIIFKALEYLNFLYIIMDELKTAMREVHNKMCAYYQK